MLVRQTAITKLLARTNTPPALAERLQRALAIRDFASRELGLPANGHYRTYADLGRPFAVWNVYAAQELSLEPRSWWYPVVGRLEYRGFFREADARRLAARLARRGDDVYVGGVPAYSTLGWFRDPVLNTFIFDDEVDLAELLFHELAHQRLFLPGETDFNEAFATAVAEEGVRRWLKATGDERSLARFEAATRRKAQFIALLSQTRSQLAALYQSAAASNERERGEARQAKARILGQLKGNYAVLKQSWDGAEEFDPWFKAPLNNARLNTVETYFGLVPAFQEHLRRSSGDLPGFYAEMERLSHLTPAERQAELQPDLAPPGATLTPRTAALPAGGGSRVKSSPSW